MASNLGQLAINGPITTTGVLLNTQYLEPPAGGGYRAAVHTGAVYIDAGVTPLRLTYTPPVDAWWQTRPMVDIVRCNTAAYCGLHLYLTLSPADTMGVSLVYLMIGFQHTNVTTYRPRYGSMLWSLAANTAYTVTALTYISAGTWDYHQGQDHMWMSGVAWSR